MLQVLKFLGFLRRLLLPKRILAWHPQQWVHPFQPQESLLLLRLMDVQGRFQGLQFLLKLCRYQALYQQVAGFESPRWSSRLAYSHRGEGCLSQS